MRAALNRPGSDCRPLRMPATRIGRVLATLNRETGGTRQRQSSRLSVQLGRVLAAGRGIPRWIRPTSLSLSGMRYVTYGHARALASRPAAGCRRPGVWGPLRRLRYATADRNTAMRLSLTQ